MTSARLATVLLSAALAAGTVVAGAGCTARTAAAPASSANDQRFVAGDGSITLAPPGDRRVAPPVTGRLLDGTAYDAASTRGAVLVLNFWASWCAPCRAEAPALERVWRQTRSLGVQFLGVNIKDDRNLARVFVRSRAVTYPSLYDQPGELAARFRGTLPPAAIPSTLVIDRRGRVAARGLGGLTADELAPVVRRVAAEPG